MWTTQPAPVLGAQQQQQQQHMRPHPTQPHTQQQQQHMRPHPTQPHTQQQHQQQFQQQQQQQQQQFQQQAGMGMVPGMAPPAIPKKSRSRSRSNGSSTGGVKRAADNAAHATTAVPGPMHRSQTAGMASATAVQTARNVQAARRGSNPFTQPAQTAQTAQTAQPKDASTNPFLNMQPATTTASAAKSALINPFLAGVGTEVLAATKSQHTGAPTPDQMRAEQKLRAAAAENAYLKAQAEAAIAREQELRGAAEENTRLKAEAEAAIAQQQKLEAAAAANARMKANAEAVKAQAEAAVAREQELRAVVEESARLKAVAEAAIAQQQKREAAAAANARMKAEAEAGLGRQQEAQALAAEQMRIQAEADAALLHKHQIDVAAAENTRLAQEAEAGARIEVDARAAARVKAETQTLGSPNRLAQRRKKLADLKRQKELRAQAEQATADPDPVTVVGGSLGDHTPAVVAATGAGEPNVQLAAEASGLGADVVDTAAEPVALENITGSSSAPDIDANSSMFELTSEPTSPAPIFDTSALSPPDNNPTAAPTDAVHTTAPDTVLAAPAEALPTATAPSVNESEAAFLALVGVASTLPPPSPTNAVEAPPPPVPSSTIAMELREIGAEAATMDVDAALKALLADVGDVPTELAATSTEETSVATSTKQASTTTNTTTPITGTPDATTDAHPSTVAPIDSTPATFDGNSDDFDSPPVSPTSTIDVDAALRALMADVGGPVEDPVPITGAPTPADGVDLGGGINADPSDLEAQLRLGNEAGVPVPASAEDKRAAPAQAEENTETSFTTGYMLTSTMTLPQQEEEKHDDANDSDDSEADAASIREKLAADMAALMADVDIGNETFEAADADVSLSSLPIDTSMATRHAAEELLMEEAMLKIQERIANADSDNDGEDYVSSTPTPTPNTTAVVSTTPVRAASVTRAAHGTRSPARPAGRSRPRAALDAEPSNDDSVDEPCFEEQIWRKGSDTLGRSIPVNCFVCSLAQGAGVCACAGVRISLYDKWRVGNVGRVVSRLDALCAATTLV